MVAWCLSITDVDPIKFNLIFERFLNPDRISMPDFDIDFCEDKRDQVFEYLTTKYKDSVAHIITFGKLKARMVIRDVGRVLGLAYGFVDGISKMIPFDPSRPLTLQESIDREPRFKEEIKNNVKVKKLIELSLRLEGLNRNMATHAAGVVIAGEKLANGQTARLLGPKEIDDLQQIIISNTSISVLCLILFILSLLPIFFLNKLLAIFTSICFVLLIIPLVNIGYAVTIPFLIFGLIVLIMSLIVDLIFERARKLDSFIS